MNKELKFFILGLFFLVVSGNVFGAQCSGLAFEKIGGDVSVDDVLSLKLESKDGTPIKPWINYSNATINYDSNFVNTKDDYVDFTPLLVNVYNWQFNISNDGTYDFNVSVYNSTNDLCSINLTVEVLPEFLLPNLSQNVTDIPQKMIVNNVYDFNLSFKNSGLGDLFNLTGVLNSLDEVFELNSAIFNVSQIVGGNTEVNQYNITTKTCGVSNFEVVTLNYFDSKGNLMAPINPISKSFEVIGSNIDVIDNSFSFEKLGNPTSSVVLNATVKNIGDLSGDGISVKFYYNSYDNLIGEVLVGTLGINDSKNVSIVWNNPNGGNHVIKTLVTGLNECPTNNKEDMNLVVDIKSDEQSGGGGSSSKKDKEENIENVTIIEDVDLNETIDIKKNESSDNLVDKNDKVEDTSNSSNVNLTKEDSNFLKFKDKILEGNSTKSKLKELISKKSDGSNGGLSSLFIFVILGLAVVGIVVFILKRKKLNKEYKE